MVTTEADLDDLALAIVLAAKDRPDRTHGQLCPVWTQSKRGTVVVPLTKCNCWRREFWMSVVRDVRAAGWTPPAV